MKKESQERCLIIFPETVTENKREIERVKRERDTHTDRRKE